MCKPPTLPQNKREEEGDVEREGKQGRERSSEKGHAAFIDHTDRG